MIAAGSCPGPAFNVAGTSGFYAQMTGLLAGFAFTAIVVLLTPTQNQERETIEGDSTQGSDDNKTSIIRAQIKANDNELMLALLAAFFALLIATLTYSVLAGETLPQARGRAAAEELVDGVPFGLAVMMLFHGVTMLMDNGNVSQVAVWFSRVVAVGVAPVLTLYYITNGATDTESARLAQHGSKLICSGSFALPMLGIILTVVLAVVLIASLAIGRRISKVRGVMRKLQVAPPIVVIGFSFGAALLAGTLSTRSDDFLVSQSILNWYLVLTSVVLAVIAAILAIGGGRDRAITENTVSKDRPSTSTAEAPSAVPVGQLITWRNPTLKAGAALVLGAVGGIIFKAIFRRRR